MSRLSISAGVALLSSLAVLSACQTADLIRASGRGNPDIVKSLLDQPGVDVNEKDSRDRSAIIWAASAGHTEVVRMLAAKGARLDDSDSEGNTGLHYAAFRGRTKVVEALLLLKANPEAINKKGRTALILAIQSNMKETVTALLKRANAAHADTDGWTPMHYAVWQGNVALIDLLLAARAPVDAIDQQGFTPLMLAVKAGRHDLVRKLLAAGAKPSRKDGHGNSAITVALMNESPEMARMLKRAGGATMPWDDLLLAAYDGDPYAMQRALRLGMPVHVRTNRAASPLMWAARSGRVDSVRVLMMNGADANETTTMGQSALFEALGQRRWAIARLLFESRKKREKGQPASYLTDTYEDRPAFTPEERRLFSPADLLAMAAGSGDLALVKEALDRKADVNASSSLDETPLMMASSANHADVVRQLLQANANPAAMDRRGWTALTYAVEEGREGHEKVVAELIDGGVPVNQQDYFEKRTAILRATMRNDLAVIDLLVKAEADAVIPDIMGNTPIHFCAVNNRIDALQRLRPRLDLNQRDAEGKTALHWAVAKWNQPLLALLLQWGAHRDPRDRYGITPLSYAVRYRSRPLAEALLTAKADPNAADGQGMTPLMIATSAGDVDLTRLLLEAGANPNLRNAMGQSALQLAQKAGSSQIETLLRSKGATE